MTVPTPTGPAAAPAGDPGDRRGSGCGCLGNPQAQCVLLSPLPGARGRLNAKVMGRPGRAVRGGPVFCCPHTALSRSRLFTRPLIGPGRTDNLRIPRKGLTIAQLVEAAVALARLRQDFRGLRDPRAWGKSPERARKWLSKQTKRGGFVKHIAAEQYQGIIKKLALEVQRDERSLRVLCSETMPLSPPERMHHSQLSPVLRLKLNRNLYVQQFLVLCKLMSINPAAFFVPTDDMDVAREIARASDQLVKVSAGERRRLLELIHQAAMAAIPNR